MGGRKGGAFEVPDFLKQNVHSDLIAVGEKDMFDKALAEQEAKNKQEGAGLSMAELARQKREAAEKEIEAKKASMP